eukprot:gene13345-28270_t
MMTSSPVTFDDEFIPLTTMPTSRLTDVLNLLQNKKPSVLNLDACLPRGNIAVLRTVLYKIDEVRSVKTLSLRFNPFGDADIQILTEWILGNNYLEVLYLLGSSLDAPHRLAIEDAWKKNMRGQHTDNMGHTFIRVPLELPNATVQNLA